MSNSVFALQFFIKQALVQCPDKLSLVNTTYVKICCKYTNFMITRQYFLIKLTTKHEKTILCAASLSAYDEAALYLLDYQMLSNMPQIRLQKAVFWTLKDGLLHRRLPSFAIHPQFRCMPPCVKTLFCLVYDNKLELTDYRRDRFRFYGR